MGLTFAKSCDRLIAESATSGVESVVEPRRLSVMTADSFILLNTTFKYNPFG